MANLVWVLESEKIYARLCQTAEVATLVAVAAHEQLWDIETLVGYLRERVTACLIFVNIVQVLRRAEINQLHSTVAAQHYVFGVNIPVDYTGGVYIVKRIQQLASPDDDLLLCEVS